MENETVFHLDPNQSDEEREDLIRRMMAAEGLGPDD